MKRAFKNLAEMIRQAEPNASFAFEFWDGETCSIGNDPKFTLRFRSEESIKDLIARKWLAFGEAYTSGDIEVAGDLREPLRLGIAVHYNDSPGSIRYKLELLRAYLITRNSRRIAATNISYHYDRDDELYELYLDESKAYSCAYFRTENDSLEQAQQNKYEHVCRKLMLKPYDRLLDIGCGYGGMLIYAAKNYGIKGVGCTISRNQYRYANEKIKQLGLQKQIEVILEDYRDLSGTFDKLVSIGMLEHVGKEFLHKFMKVTSEVLTRGGLGLLHTIGKDHQTPGDAWVMRHIFPGAYIPHLAELAEHMGSAGFSILDVENLRMHYARTLELWADNFEKNVDKARGMFDETFVRMWRLFLNACSIGFKYGGTGLFQMLFSNGLNNDLPLTRAHYYAPYDD
jgi:cyclopropane-fatty-acyl-phospholipid synthase